LGSVQKNLSIGVVQAGRTGRNGSFFSATPFGLQSTNGLTEYLLLQNFVINNIKYLHIQFFENSFIVPKSYRWS